MAPDERWLIVVASLSSPVCFSIRPQPFSVWTPVVGARRTRGTATDPREGGGGGSVQAGPDGVVVASPDIHQHGFTKPPASYTGWRQKLSPVGS